MSVRLCPAAEMSYEISVETVPAVKWTGDYRKLAVEVVAPGDAASDELEVGPYSRG